MRNSTNEKSLPISKLDLYWKDYVAVHIMATEWCNLDCHYCYAPHQFPGGMTPSQINRIIEEVEGLGLEKHWYEISGGEIMGLKYWPELVDQLLSTGCDLCLNTNGTLIDKNSIKSIESLNRRFPGHLSLSVSLDSYAPHINESIRVGKESNRVYKGLALLKDYDIRFRISLTLTSRNMSTIEETIRLVAQKYTREISISVLRPVFPITAENMDIFPTISEVMNMMQRIVNLKKKIGDYDLYHSFDADGQSSCEAGRDRLVIKRNGDVTACYTLQTEEDVVGNIFCEPLADIMSRLSELHKDRDNRILLCEHQEKHWGNPPYRIGK